MELLCSAVIVIVSFSIFLRSTSSSMIIANQAYDTNQLLMLGSELMMVINANKNVIENTSFSDFNTLLYELYGSTVAQDRYELDKYDYHVAIVNTSGNASRIISTAQSRFNIEEIFKDAQINLPAPLENTKLIVVNAMAKDYEGSAVYFGLF